MFSYEERRIFKKNKRKVGKWGRSLLAFTFLSFSNEDWVWGMNYIFRLYIYIVVGM